MGDPVYLKTEAGHDEIRTRARKLEHKLRALLLLVNGERPRSELLGQLGGLGIDDQAITTLLDAGLIVPATTPGPEPVAPRATPSESASPDRTQGAAPVFSADATPEADAADTTASLAADTYRRVYRFYTETIGQQLGLRGYLLQVKVEKAASLPELAALREPFHAALEKARGAPVALGLVAELDRLLAGVGEQAA